MQETKSEGLNALYESGQRNQKYYGTENPSSDILETFAIEPDRPQVVRLTTDEFSSMCPVTGQPDWATIYISYIPDMLCVESKSLKLYLMRFRQHGEFHESCVQRIYRDLTNVIKPHLLQVVGDFTARGGLAIKPISVGGRSACDSDWLDANAMAINAVLGWGTANTKGVLR